MINFVQRIPKCVSVATWYKPSCPGTWNYVFETSFLYFDWLISILNKNAIIQTLLNIFPFEMTIASNSLGKFCFSHLAASLRQLFSAENFGLRPSFSFRSGKNKKSRTLSWPLIHLDQDDDLQSRRSSHQRTDRQECPRRPSSGWAIF